MINAHGIEFIVAGCFSQAKDYARSSGLESRQWRYVASAKDLRGVVNPRVVFLGTWWKRKDISEINRIVETSRIAKAKSPRHPDQT